MNKGAKEMRQETNTKEKNQDTHLYIPVTIES